MRPNLVQIYMDNSKTRDRNLDIDYVLSNKTFIKPLSGKGHLVNKNILTSPVIYAKDFAYDMKALHKAKKGLANDHELGKINDLGMKIGGLLIAAYLMTRKQTPLKKAMELVGFASFFGAMALWPKLALQLPARLIHGFNIRKEYEDSYGRKKMFFQDPQYIPWDLVDDEKINKIGDRMGISNDIPNRKAFIQDKMKKIAIQNNTLWMMTAGFATPIMSALVCNLCEKPLNRILDKYNGEKADKLLLNIENNSQKFKDESAIKQLEEILVKNNGKHISKDFINEVNTIFTNNFDNVTSKAIQSDISVLLSDNKHLFDETVLQNLINNINSKLPNAKITDFGRFANVVKDYTGKNLTEPELQKLTGIILKEFKTTLKEKGIADYEINNMLHKLRDEKDIIMSSLKIKSGMILNEEKIAELKQIFSSLTDFRAKNALLDKYIYMKVGAAPETAIANSFNSITDSLPEIFKFTDKEITSVRHDRKLTGQLLREKLEHITSNEEEYKKVLGTIIDKISSLDKNISALEGNVEGSYENAVNAIFDEAANSLRNKLPNTADSLVGKNGVVEGSLKNIQLSYAKNRLLGVKSSLYRLINTLDFYKRVSSLQNLSTIENIPKEIKEEIVEFCKKLTVEGSTSDFMTKFYELRNPNPNRTNYGALEVKDGKVINEYLGKAVNGGKVNLPNDKSFFENVMRLLYQEQMHPQTEKLLVSPTLKNALSQFRREFAHDLGGSFYFAKPYHILDGKMSFASSFIKFLKVGMTPEQMFHNVIKNKYNTNRWLKVYGGLGAALFGMTVISQFFFGKMKEPERIKND